MLGGPGRRRPAAASCRLRRVCCVLIARQKEKNTILLFESAKRIHETLSCIASEYSKTKKVSLCREMTKIYENIERGTATSLLEKIKNNKLILKGEFVIVIESFSSNDTDLIFDNKIYKSFLKNMPTKEAAKLISMITKENKRDIYKKLSELTNTSENTVRRKRTALKLLPVFKKLSAEKGDAVSDVRLGGQRPRRGLRGQGPAGRCFRADRLPEGKYQRAQQLPRRGSRAKVRDPLGHRSLKHRP